MYQFCQCQISLLDQQSSVVWPTELRRHVTESAVWFPSHYDRWYSPDNGSEQIKVTTNSNWKYIWNEISQISRCHSNAVADPGSYVLQPRQNKSCFKASLKTVPQKKQKDTDTLPKNQGVLGTISPKPTKSLQNPANRKSFYRVVHRVSYTFSQWIVAVWPLTQRNRATFDRVVAIIQSLWRLNSTDFECGTVEYTGWAMLAEVTVAPLWGWSIKTGRPAFSLLFLRCRQIEKPVICSANQKAYNPFGLGASKGLASLPGHRLLWGWLPSLAFISN